MNEKNKELQNVILNIYKEFKKICEKYNLTYYAIGGTCIGAIRHKGFIPWDDDIDVAMPMSDLLKFKEVANKELNKNYKVVDYLDAERFYRNNFFIKIEDVRTTFVEKFESNDIRKYKGVFIDIMPICGCPKEKKKKDRLIFQFYRYTKLNQSKNKKISEIESIKGKILWIALKPFVFYHKNTFFFKKSEELALKYPITRDFDVLFTWRIPVVGNYKNCFSYDYFSNAIDFPFEDTTIKCPVKYDDYLKEDFGDYMVFPPEEKRITHLPFLFSLDRSYTKYQEEQEKRG